MSKGYVIWGAGYFVKITCVVCVISFLFGFRWVRVVYSWYGGELLKYKRGRGNSGDVRDKVRGNV